MLLLKHNNLSSEELILIERHYLRWQDVSIRPCVITDASVLDFSLSEIHGYLLGIFSSLNVPETLDITSSQLLDFLLDVEKTYYDTPYHSFHHAADVVSVLYYILVDLNARQYLDDLDIALVLIAAICHDTGHSGYNNTYHIKLQTELAKRFNNTSVLETLSVEIAVQLLEKHQFFKAHQKSERYLYIKQVILSTDMVYHYELLEHASQLEQRISDLWLLGSSETSSSSSLGSDLDQTQRLTFACIILHASDISNTVRLWPISKQWSDLIVQEFFHQGDMEKQLGLTVSPGMDREVATQASISLTFGDQVVKPYFEALAALVPAASIFLETLDDNLYEWTHIKEEMPSPSSSFSMKPFNVPAGTLLQTKPIIRSSSYTCINTSFPHHTTLFRRKSAEHC